MTRLATLTVEMAANVARLRQDMDSARRTVDSAMSQIRTAAGLAAGALGALGVGLSAGAMATWIKGAVDAADETSKLAQKVGIATDQVAGLQLAFQQSGLAADDVQSMLARLARQIADNGDMLKAMGIETRTASGALRSTRDVLGEVADRFASYSDGAAKTALAIEGFGRSGAAIIPLLNGGAAAIDEFDRVARELGLTIDQRTARAAESFNDTVELIGMSSRGVATRIAAELLPTLSGLATQFFESMNKGVRLQLVADGLSVSLRGMYVAGVGIIETFSTVGSVLGGVAAAIDLAVRGRLAEAGRVLALLRDDIGDGWRGAAESMRKAWQSAGGTAADTLSGIAGAMRAQAPIVEAGTAQADKAASAFARLRDKLVGKSSGVDADYIANLALLESAYRSGVIPSLESYRSLVEAYIEMQPGVVAARKAEVAAIAEQGRALDALVEAQSERDRQAMDALIAIDREIAAQREANAEIGLTSEQLAALRITRAEHALAIDEETLANLRASGADAQRIAALEEQIGLTRELVALRRDGAAAQANVESARRIRDEWKTTADSIERSLTDALFRAAESGKTAFETLRDALRGMFNNLVLRPVINAVVGASGLGSAGSAMAGGGGAGSTLSSLSSISSLAGISGITGALGSGIAAGLANGAGLAGSMSAAGSLLGTGTLAGGAAGAGMAIGALGPYALAAYAAYRIIKSLTRRRVTGAGIEGTLGGSGGFDGRSFEEWRRRLGGGGRSTGALDPAMQSGIADAALATRDAVTGYAQALGLPVDALRSYTQALRIDTRGLSPEDVQKRIQESIAAYRDGLAASLGESVRVFARSGESAGDTLERLSTSLTAVNSVLGMLGQSLLSISASGGDAASRLLDLFGGREAFGGAANAYLQAYYSEAERTALASNLVREELRRLGLAMPSTRSEFRRLVESMDLTSDSGRTAYAALLRLAPAFDAIAKASEDARRAVRTAWADAAQSIIDAARAIRGDAQGQPGQSFDDLTARVRSGDIAAQSQLTDAARAAIDAARASSRDAVDFMREQAAIAASLEQTARDIAARAAGEKPIPGDPPGQPLITVPTKKELTAADVAVLRDEIRALREENRASGAVIAENTAATARVLDRWDRDTLPPAYGTQG